MKFAWSPPGTFLMGSPPDEEDREDDEQQHRVTLTRGFWLGVTPVTQAQWQAVLGSNPSHYQGDDRPVEQVSWNDCRKRCQRLAEGDGRRYRLPTEAGWEYACRASTTTPFHFGATISTDLANYNGKYTYGKGPKGVSRRQTTPVGSFPVSVRTPSARALRLESCYTHRRSPWWQNRPSGSTGEALANVPASAVHRRRLGSALALKLRFLRGCR
jgi:formylglycine-generating enzyme required for sulfatase activity